MPSTPTPKRSPAQKRGRPQKYGGPAAVVAVTLPVQVIEALRQVHGDLGWAIVRLAAQRNRPRARGATSAAQLVEIGAQQSLIVVDPAVVGRLPGVQLVPLSGGQAFLALDPGLGLVDLEARVAERLRHVTTATSKQRALRQLLTRLRAWRRRRTLVFESRSILIARQTRAR